MCDETGWYRGYNRSLIIKERFFYFEGRNYVSKKIKRNF